ncbi:MAG: adenylosuccinate lyase [Firmicutes bacterium]|nr:adenylosuccinate lyase [Bacillota bacterium]MCL2255547.1 adenylosuccinate lyase [Bacillota bacterium]
MTTNTYENPLTTRYSSMPMQNLFSSDVKFLTWRKLWIELARGQRELGLQISSEQIEDLEKNAHDIDFKRAGEIERETRHDVMAHIKAFGEKAKKAAPIIHLGSTSCYVTDNTDIIILRDALNLIKSQLVLIINELATFAKKHKDLPCLAFTHFQSAQPTTVGKRACLWIADLMSDLEDLDAVLKKIKFFGCKGATGTAASFLSLFENNHQKVLELEKKIAKKFGFLEIYPISGQTYSRKLDFSVLAVLSSIAQSAMKFSNDFRLLSHLKELEEPFLKTQVGSSAMPYKRNPMRSERITSLSRFVNVTLLNASFTASEQWLERTLDDSANRRVILPQMFLATDAILSLFVDIMSGAVVNKGVIKKNLKTELPFLATENILMHAVKKGGNRQELHEKIKQYSLKASEEIKKGGKNDLLNKILDDDDFSLSKEELDKILVVEDFIGRSIEQVDEFLVGVNEMLKTNKKLIKDKNEIKV